MKLTIEGTPEELREKRDTLLKALVAEFQALDPELASIIEKALPQREPQLKYKVLRQVAAAARKGYQDQLGKMLDDIDAVLNTEPVQHSRKPTPEPEALTKVQKASAPESAPLSESESARAARLWQELGDAATRDEVQKGEFGEPGEPGEAEEKDPGAEPEDPDYDEEGNPIIDPDTGLSPSEEKQAREEGTLDEEEDEGDEEAELSLDLADQLQKGRKTKRNPHGGPFVGPRGGLWADPQHKIHWDPEKHGKVPKKVQKEADEKASDPGERFDGDQLKRLLISMGDRMYELQAENPMELDATGFSRNDMDRWYDVRGDVLKMQRLLQKYRRQLLTDERDEWARGNWWRAGLGENIPDQVVTWQYHERFGSLNIRLDGWIGSRELFGQVHALFKRLGMWKDRASGMYVLREPEGFDFDAFKRDISALLPGIRLPEAPPTPLPTEEEKRAETEKTIAAAKSPVDAIWDGLASGKIDNAVGMKWHEKERTFEFRFPKGILSALFSNKRGMLPSITRWDTTTQPWNVKVFDIETAKLAIDRIKELTPKFTIATEGLEEAQAARDKQVITTQAPIPAVVEKLGINPETGEKFELFSFQNEGVRFLIENGDEGGAMLGDEMGTGKTLQYLAFMMATGRKSIAVVPNNVRRQWVEEAALFFPDYAKPRELDAGELLKTKRALKAKLKRDPKPGEIAEALGLLGTNLVSINYESVAKFRPILEWLAENEGYDSMVVDESHRMKNPKAKQTQAIQGIRKKLKTAVTMSGTSIKNKKEEFQTQVELTRPGMFKMKTGYDKFRRPYQYSEIRDLTIGELWDKMRPFYLSRAKEVVLKDLPPRLTTIARITTDPKMTPDLASTPDKYIANARFMAYAEAKEQGLSDDAARQAGEGAAEEAREEIEDLRSRIRGGDIELWGEAGELGGPQISEEDILARALFDKSVGTYQRIRIALAQAKVPHTVEFVRGMLEDTDRNLLIFTESKAAVRRFKEAFGDDIAVHTGDESREEKDRVKKLFDRRYRPAEDSDPPPPRMMVLTTPSAKEGLNLTAADMVVFNDLPFTAADLQQAEARAHRIGSQNKVNVYWMNAEDNDMDRMLADIVKRKLHLSEKANKGRQITEEDRKWMDKDVTPADLMAELRGELSGRGGKAPTVTTTTAEGKTATTTAPTTPETAGAASNQPTTAPAPPSPPTKQPKPARGKAPPTIKMSAGLVSAFETEVHELAADPEGHGLGAEDGRVYRLLADAHDQKTDRFRMPDNVADAEAMGAVLTDISNAADDRAEDKSAPADTRKIHRSIASTTATLSVKLAKHVRALREAGPVRTPVPKPEPEVKVRMIDTPRPPEPEVAAPEATSAVGATTDNPSVEQTNVKAEPRLQAAPKPIRAVMTALHRQEARMAAAGEGGFPTKRMTPREAKTIHDWLVENGGEYGGGAGPVDYRTVTWQHPAGMLTWSYDTRAREYSLSYTSQTEAVWEGPEPDPDRESHSKTADLSGDATGQLSLFKSDLAAAWLDSFDTAYELHQAAQIPPEPSAMGARSARAPEAILGDGQGSGAAATGVSDDDPEMAKSGPFVGPRGGLWADPAHTVHWDPAKHGAKPKRSVQMELRLEAKEHGVDLPGYFPSGSNHAGEIEGFASLGFNVGVAAHDLDVEGFAEDALLALAGSRTKVFVDSGAYAEVKPNFPKPGDPPEKRPYPELPIGLVTDPKKGPITPEEWDRRLGLYERLVEKLGSQLYAVAPDRVGDQRITLERMRTYRARVQALRMKGANILAPIQKGDLSMAEFDAKVAETLGFNDFVRAIPMAKDATTPEELRAFLEQRKPGRLHLLGMGPKSDLYPDLMRIIREVSPNTSVTVDSVAISAAVERPIKGPPRKLTAAQDRVRERFNQAVFYETVDGLDYTDAIAQPSLWAPPAIRKWGAAQLGLSGVEARAFVKDPDAHVREHIIEDPRVDQVLDAMWHRHAAGALEQVPGKPVGKMRMVGGKLTVRERKRGGIQEAMSPEGIIPRRSYESVTEAARAALRGLQKRNAPADQIERARQYLFDVAFTHANHVHGALRSGELRPKAYEELHAGGPLGPLDSFDPDNTKWWPDDPDLRKAAPYVGPRGGLWADPEHTIHWEGEGKQRGLPIKPRPQESDSQRIARQLVDAQKAEDAWGRMTLAIEQVHDRLQAISDKIGWSGRIPRKSLAKEVDEIRAEFMAKVPPPEVFMAGGLEVEALHSSVEQYAAEVVHMALDHRRSVLTSKDDVTNRLVWSADEVRESFFSGMNKIRGRRDDSATVFQQGQGFTAMPAETKEQAAERAKEMERWEATHRRNISRQLSDAAKLPKAHHDLLRQAKTRVRFMVHRAGSEAAHELLGGVATFDERTHADLIEMRSWSAHTHKGFEDGVTISHEIGHIIDRLVSRTMATINERIEMGDDYRFDPTREFTLSLADKVSEVRGRPIKDAKYMTASEVDWSTRANEWFAEAYRYAYRDGDEMQTTLQAGDFDHQAFRSMVDRLVAAAVQKGAAPVERYVEEPVKLVKAALSEPLGHDHTKPIADREERLYSAVQRELIKRGAAKPGDFDRGGPLYGRSNNELVSWLESLKANNGGM